MDSTFGWLLGVPLTWSEILFRKFRYEVVQRHVLLTPGIWFYYCIPSHINNNNNPCFYLWLLLSIVYIYLIIIDNIMSFIFENMPGFALAPGIFDSGMLIRLAVGAIEEEYPPTTKSVPQLPVTQLSWTKIRKTKGSFRERHHKRSLRS